MIVKYQMVLSGTFTLNFFLAVDLWKVFIKIKLNQNSVPLFGIWSHILEVPGTLSQVLPTFTTVVLFFSIIVKFLIKITRNLSYTMFLPSLSSFGFDGVPLEDLLRLLTSWVPQTFCVQNVIKLFVSMALIFEKGRGNVSYTLGFIQLPSCIHHLE